IIVPDPRSSGLKPAPQPGDKVVVRLDEWKERFHPLLGEITSRLGRTHEPRTELLGVLEKFGLDPKFPEAVEREASTLPDRIRPEDAAERQDYRAIPTFTI